MVVAYLDSIGSNLSPQSFCGISTSTDGGANFSRLPERFNAAGSCLSESTVFYSRAAAKWYTSFVSNGCGALGIAQWESVDGITWANSGCAFSGSQTDLPTTWVDNNPASPFYGRQYAAFNDFNVGGGAVRATRSTDNGTTWSAPSPVYAAGFRRAVKIFGSPGTDGTVFVETMAEGGGDSPRDRILSTVPLMAA